MTPMVFYFYNTEESPVEFGGAAFAGMEAQMRDLSSRSVSPLTWA
jgi:hypothetical protein